MFPDSYSATFARDAVSLAAPAISSDVRPRADCVAFAQCNSSSSPPFNLEACVTAAPEFERAYRLPSARRGGNDAAVRMITHSLGRRGVEAVG